MSSSNAKLPLWTVITPAIAVGVLVAAFSGLHGGFFVVVIAASLAGSVFAAVHHADVVAHRVGEPYGTLVLALAVWKMLVLRALPFGLLLLMRMSAGV